MDYLSTTGRIFDIQRFSIHDGQGIRTIVFLKGCALRCRWCCNPESQEYAIQTMMVQGKPKVMGRDVTVKEVLDIVEKDRVYYRRSGGGMTLSGGECLCQPEYAAALLKGAHEQGIRTAIESTAFAKYEAIDALLPDLDQFLMDIKHMDSRKHKEYTGQPNDLILANAAKIAASGKTELSIRVPVIPGFNNSRHEIQAIAAFAGSLRGVKRLHLLPYHRLGQDKYDGLGREYTMKGIVPMKQDYMDMLLDVAKKASGLDCQIGG